MSKGIKVKNKQNNLHNNIKSNNWYEIRPLYKIMIIKDNKFEEYNDPYHFGLLLPEYDLSLFQQGHFWHVDSLLGSHFIDKDGIKGCRFAVWAPDVISVSVVGDFNNWDPSCNPMRKRVEYSVWELFIPGDNFNLNCYKYSITSEFGNRILKIDPYAQLFEVPPKNSSIISSFDDDFKGVIIILFQGK